MINVENTQSWLGLIQHNTQLSYTSSSFRSPLHLDFSFRYESGGLL